MAATFYQLNYNSAERPDTAWLLENGVILTQPNNHDMVVASHTQSENTSVFIALYNNNSIPGIVVCSKKSGANATGNTAGNYFPGLMFSVTTNTLYNGFYYVYTPTTLNHWSPAFEMFASLNEALEFAETFINIPSVDVANLSGIFVGSTEIKKAYIGSSQIYGKPYSITATVMNATAASGNPTTVRAGKTATLNFIFDGTTYECPTVAPVVTNATGTWTKNSATSGTMVLSNPTGAVSFTVAGQETTPQLDTPTNLSVSGTMATFDEVENAESYEFFVDDVSIGTYTPTTGYTVTLADNTYTNGGDPADDAPIYDGTDTTGTLLGKGDGTYQVSSGHILIASNEFVFSTGTTTGGVQFNSSLSDNHNIVYDVTGDGSITNGKFCCFVEGTKITLADGSTKNVEDITYDDDLLVWDFYEGKFGTAKPMWIAPEHTADYYYRVEIEGGTVLKLVGSDGKSHRLYDYEAKQFSYPQDMGRNHTIDQNYKGLHIEKIERIDEPVKYYNIITETHYNLYAEGILTSCRLSNRYGIAQPFSRTCSQMKYDTNDVKMTEEEVQAYIDALER